MTFKSGVFPGGKNRKYLNVQVLLENLAVKNLKCQINIVLFYIYITYIILLVLHHFIRHIK